jgi:hypothetical protein
MCFENNSSRKNAPHEREEGDRPGGSGRGVEWRMSMAVGKNHSEGSTNISVTVVLGADAKLYKVS